MKSIRPFVSGLMACAIVIGMATSLAAQTARDGLAKVVNIHGSARYMTTESPAWRPLKTGAILKPGTIVQTALDSYVDLVLNNPNAIAANSLGNVGAPSTTTTVSASQSKAEQDAVRIFENTVLGIDKLNVTQTGADKVTDTQLDLKAGRILGTVKKLSTASRYEIKIPNGVAGIRGTVYTLSADGVLTVISGTVWLSFVGADGSPITKEVKTGEQYDAKTGQVTTVPHDVWLDLQSQTRQLRIGRNQPTVIPAGDITIHIVSPTRASAPIQVPEQGG